MWDNYSKYEQLQGFIKFFWSIVKLRIFRKVKLKENNKWSQPYRDIFKEIMDSPENKEDLIDY